MREVSPYLPRRRSRLSPLEEREIDRLSHRLVSGVARVQVVAGIVRLEKLLGIVRVARRLVEIDDAIVGVPGPNPLVQSLTLFFASFGVIRRTPERRQRRAVDPDPSRVRLFDELLVSGDEIFSGRRRILSRVSD